jgi:hypothetical protein
VIERIRQDCESIRHSLPGFQKDTLALPDWSTQGGIATAYRDSNKHIRSIVAAVYGEMGKTLYEFYFVNDTLICAVIKDHAYNASPLLDSAHAKQIGSERFDANKSNIVHDSYFYSGHKLLLREGPDLKQVRKKGAWGGGSTDIKGILRKLLQKFHAEH